MDCSTLDYALVAIALATFSFLISAIYLITWCSNGKHEVEKEEEEEEEELFDAQALLDNVRDAMTSSNDFYVLNRDVDSDGSDDSNESFFREDTALLQEYPALVDMGVNPGNIGTPMIWLNAEEQETLKTDVARRHGLRKKRAIDKCSPHPLACRHCSKKYDTNQKRTPRLLQCGHTICTYCVSLLLSYASLSVVDGPSIQCMCCSRPSFLSDFTDLRVNHAVMNVIKASSFWKSFLSKTQPVLKCPRCGDDYSNRVAKKTPRVSPVCGHSCCELCAREMVAMYGRFECAECHEVIGVRGNWKKVFKKNRTVKELLEVM